MTNRLHIRVTKTDSGISYELMKGDEKIAELSYTDIVEMIMQFTSCLRYR